MKAQITEARSSSARIGLFPSQSITGRCCYVGACSQPGVQEYSEITGQCIHTERRIFSQRRLFYQTKIFKDAILCSLPPPTPFLLCFRSLSFSPCTNPVQARNYTKCFVLKKANTRCSVLLVGKLVCPAWFNC